MFRCIYILSKPEIFPSNTMFLLHTHNAQRTPDYAFVAQTAQTAQTHISVVFHESLRILHANILFVISVQDSTTYSYIENVTRTCYFFTPTYLRPRTKNRFFFIFVYVYIEYSIRVPTDLILYKKYNFCIDVLFLAPIRLQPSKITKITNKTTGNNFDPTPFSWLKVCLLKKKKKNCKACGTRHAVPTFSYSFFSSIN